MSLTVFGYGSLMVSPPLPDAVVRWERARLEGWRRTLDKRSLPRGIEAHEARFPEVPGWVEGQRRVSLAAGLVPGGGVVEGMVLTWPTEVAPRVLAELDRREGVVPGRAPREQHYAVTALDVAVGGARVRARTYVTNVGGPRHAPDLSEDDVAAVLLGATPREDRGRGRGAFYVLQAVDVLREAGVRDERWERLAARLARRV